jgi:hypothetical protein
MQSGINDFETGVAKSAGNNFGAAVVTVQPRFSDKYA